MDEHGFEARLRHLEHIVTGQAASAIPRTTKTSILKRIDALKKELNTHPFLVYHGKHRIHELVDDGHVKLLDPADSTLAMERELLTPETKLELVLAACDDLEQFAAQVRQVKSLEHVVSGSEYDALETLGPQLAPLEARHAEQTKQLEEITKKISQAMDNYNGIVNTLSEIFISWDDILSTMETHVTALERQRAAK